MPKIRDYQDYAHYDRSFLLKPNQKVECDDKGYLLCCGGDLLDGKYQISNFLSQGTFATTVEAIDLGEKRARAIRIYRKALKYANYARHEIRALLKLVHLDATYSHLFVMLWDAFEYHGHTCLVYEKLGESLQQHLERTERRPLALQHVQSIGQQLCYAIEFLHDNKLTHGDLKPTKVRFAQLPATTTKTKTTALTDTNIRIVDFSLATFDDEDHSVLMQTRSYRAPEVHLKLGWSHPIDVWSIGCILYELYTGRMLFPPEQALSLGVMEAVLGQKFPIEMKPKRAPWAQQLKKAPIAPTASTTPTIDDVFNARERSANEISLCQLIKGMLIYQPAKRMSLKAALQNAFFKNTIQ